MVLVPVGVIVLAENSEACAVDDQAECSDEDRAVESDWHRRHEPPDTFPSHDQGEQREHRGARERGQGIHFPRTEVEARILRMGAGVAVGEHRDGERRSMAPHVEPSARSAIEPKATPAAISTVIVTNVMTMTIASGAQRISSGPGRRCGRAPSLYGFGMHMPCPRGLSEASRSGVLKQLGGTSVVPTVPPEYSNPTKPWGFEVCRKTRTGHSTPITVKPRQDQVDAQITENRRREPHDGTGRPPAFRATRG